MPVYDTSKLADARTVAENLAGLPKEALLYIAGYAEGCRDKPNRKRKKKEQTNGEKEARLWGRERGSGKAMERVVLRNDGNNTKLEIDGVEIQNLYSVKIEKKPDSPIRIELSGSVTNEVLVEI